MIMAKNTVVICLMFLVASSVIYEVQGTFLLKLYMQRKLFPRRCMDFTPFACNAMLNLVSNLQKVCPVTREFKQFFTNLQGYVSFIESASASSNNIDSMMTTKCDGLAKALSILTGVKDSSNFKLTMLSMGKTLIELKKSGSMRMTLSQKKELVIAMVKWTRMLATFVKTASETLGKSIDISSYGLDVDVNSAVGSGSDSDESTPSGSSPTETENQNSDSTNTESESNSESTENITTDGTSDSSSGSPTSSNPSNSTPIDGKTSNKGNESGTSEKKESSSESATKESSSGTTSSTSVKQVETETSKEVLSFITKLEKKYLGNEELKVFFEKLKASMTASSTISSKTAADYASVAKSAASKLAEAMTYVSSKFGKSEKIEACQDQVMNSLKELQDINNQIVSEKEVTTTQQTEIKQTITKFEKVTKEFVEVAAASSSESSTTSSSKQHSMSKQSIDSSEERTSSSHLNNVEMATSN